MISAALWAAPIVALGGLAVWTLVDFLGITDQALASELILPLLISLIVIALGVRISNLKLRRFGLLLLIATYFVAHAVALPPDPAPLLGFMTLALVALELRLLAARFAPIYLLRLGAEDRARLDDALGRSVLRIVVVSAIAFLGSVLAADLALAGTLPVTSIPTALLLAGALIAVVFLLALWPTQRPPPALSTARPAPIQTPK